VHATNFFDRLAIKRYLEVKKEEKKNCKKNDREFKDKNRSKIGFKLATY